MQKMIYFAGPFPENVCWSSWLGFEVIMESHFSFMTATICIGVDYGMGTRSHGAGIPNDRELDQFIGAISVNTNPIGYGER